MITSAMIRPGVVLQGRYRVICQIGGGGFGQVFEVDDGGVAKVLKVLKLEHFQSSIIKQKAIALFKREAELLSRLQHRGIPRVEPDGYFTLSEGGEPLHCLVMEKIPGSNLQEWLKAQSNQPITTQKAQEWLIQLVEILNELHQHQYFHRDIKPSNIMLKPDGQLVLIDFGAVREVTESYLQKQKGHETGTVLISPGYTPAEQAEGHAVPQSDFFALGRSFVYLLTGKSPLDFPKNPQTGELLWRDYATQVSSEFADLIDKLIAPFPGQRSQNCQEILEYLGKSTQNTLFSKLVATIPGLSHLGTKHKITKKKPLQRRLQWIITSLLLFTGFNLWKSAPDIAFELNEWGFDSKNLVNAELYYRLALIFDPKMPEPSYNLGLLYEDQNKFNQAEAAYKRAIKQGWVDAYNNLARLYILQKQSLKAVLLLEKQLPSASEDKTKYAILKNLGWANMELGRYEEAQTYLKKAMTIPSMRPSAYCLNIQLLELQQLKQQALPDLHKCLNLEPKTPEEYEWRNQARKIMATLQQNTKSKNTGIE
ncbi:protein kinase [Nostoc punctiforme FACHB-252]|uniref:non-specific serine/threonine protein kinase n=1 Tax=Nostoc punctiforme FACHB-252 TaxID=1357509 RepID=A0ABR8HMH9_NOSPU|nr:serine/threonine-protein kinase [Nostoc punctiforme]MBD2616175.1 protein kinase [Nostoc punctiforme FACHB-252]